MNAAAETLVTRPAANGTDHAVVHIDDWRRNRADAIRVLQSSLYPGAKDASVEMVLGYCEAARLDPFQKPVHIVPLSVKTGENQYGDETYEKRDTIMPGIGLYRIQAARTGEYAGMEEPEYGPKQTLTYKKRITEWYSEGGQRKKRESWIDATVDYPEWCKVTVYRLVKGARCAWTATEAWIENYATAGRNTHAPNSMWERRPKGQIAKCFDEETEVLTSAGFQKFSQATARILYVGENGLESCDARPFAQEYRGDMVFAAGTRLNFAVTPNHDMLTTAGKVEAGSMYAQATKMGNKFLIPRAPDFSRHDAVISDSILRLIGYYLADGSHTGYHQFRIAVSRNYKVDALRELALHQRESVKFDAGRIAEGAGRSIVTYLDKQSFTYDWSIVSEFVSEQKALSIEWVLTLSQRQARILVDALLEFDGSENGVGVRRLCQKNENVLRGFEVAAVQAGYSVSSRKPMHSDIGSSFSITISDAAHFPVVRGVEHNSASLKLIKNESGRVWCVTVPSGVIVVRRHGFSMLCGNCSEAQALRKAFPEAVGAAPTAEEMEGRTFETYEPQPPAATGQQNPAPEPLALTYDQTKFDTNFSRWSTLIESGRKSAAEVIATVEAAAPLSDEQKKRINEIKVGSKQ